MKQCNGGQRVRVLLNFKYGAGPEYLTKVFVYRSIKVGVFLSSQNMYVAEILCSLPTWKFNKIMCVSEYRTFAYFLNV
jgi:hypothetical protein